MRKKKGTSQSSSLSSSSISSNSSSSDSPRPEFTPAKEAEDRSFNDSGGVVISSTPGEKKSGLEVEESNKVFPMDDIWKEFEFSEENCRTTYESVASPIWDYCPNDSLWCMDEQPLLGDHFQSYPFCNYIWLVNNKVLFTWKEKYNISHKEKGLVLNFVHSLGVPLVLCVFSNISLLVNVINHLKSQVVCFILRWSFWSILKPLYVWVCFGERKAWEIPKYMWFMIIRCEVKCSTARH